MIDEPDSGDSTEGKKCTQLVLILTLTTLAIIKTLETRNKKIYNI